MRFPLGYNPVAGASARAKLLSGTYAVPAAPVQPVPPSKSLGQYRLRTLEQGQAGTCYAHGAVALVEWSARAKGLDAFPVCRRLVAYLAKALEGGGNPADGGSGVDALLSMTREKGAGIAHESLLPYTDDRNVLAQMPPSSVIRDAQACHLTLPVDVRTLDEIRSMVAANHPVTIGVWCPDAWQRPQALYDLPLGAGEYGHEPMVCGYAAAGVLHQQPCFELENWWGTIYPPHPAAVQVPGYAANGTSFWVTERYLTALFNQGNGEAASATDLDGLSGGVVEFPSTGLFL